MPEEVTTVAGTAFIEGIWGSSDTFEQACQKLLKDLDEEVAQYGEAVVGDVTISRSENAIVGSTIRIDAKTGPR